MSDKILNLNTGKPFEPISDERLAELDSWYSKFSSNSLTFCDGDYLEMRARLRQTERELQATKSRWDNERERAERKTGQAALFEREYIKAAKERDEALSKLTDLEGEYKWEREVTAGLTKERDEARAQVAEHTKSIQGGPK